VESYRAVNTVSADGSRKGKTDASWLDGKVSSSFMDSATAQVTPLELTQKLVDAAVSNGAVLIKGTVNGVPIEGNRVVGVSLEGGEVIPADTVVICAGPWYACSVTITQQHV
jgi:glycine/D-amino acid oxidase-like deaminating enzyme